MRIAQNAASVPADFQRFTIFIIAYACAICNAAAPVFFKIAEFFCICHRNCPAAAENFPFAQKSAAPKSFGAAHSVSKEPRAVRAHGRESNEIQNFRGHVHRKFYFTARKREFWRQSRQNFAMQRAANPLSKTLKEFLTVSVQRRKASALHRQVTFLQGCCSCSGCRPQRCGGSARCRSSRS